MGKEKQVSHRGTIISIEEGNIKVEIINKSMCSACHAKGFCSAGDSKDKVIDVLYYNNGEYSVGYEKINGVQGSLDFICDSVGYPIDFFTNFAKI